MDTLSPFLAALFSLIVFQLLDQAHTFRAGTSLWPSRLALPWHFL